MHGGRSETAAECMAGSNGLHFSTVSIWLNSSMTVLPIPEAQLMVSASPGSANSPLHWVFCIWSFSDLLMIR